MPMTLNTLAHKYHLGFDTVAAIVKRAGISPLMAVRQGNRTVTLYSDDVEQAVTSYVAEKNAKKRASKKANGSARYAVDASVNGRIDSMIRSIDSLTQAVSALREKVDRLESSIDQTLGTLLAPTE